MKRLTLAFIGCFLLSLGIAKAQFFLGGSMSLNNSGGNNQAGSTKVDKNKITSFGFYPWAGYFLSDQFAVGAELDLSLSKTKVPATQATQEVIGSSSSIGIVPFARYYAVKMNKFSIFGEGYVNFSIMSQKTSTGGTTTKLPKTTSIRVGVYPGVSYEISDKIELEAGIDLLNLSYSLVTVKDESVDPVTKNVTSTFNFGAGIDNIFNTGSISVGAIFKF